MGLTVAEIVDGDGDGDEVTLCNVCQNRVQTDNIFNL